MAQLSGLQKPFHRGGQGWNIAQSSRANDGVCGVEIAMSQLVAHARNLHPWDVRFAREDCLVNVLDRLADLDEADTNGVEHDVIVDVLTGNLAGDGLASGLDVEQSLD